MIVSSVIIILDFIKQKDRIPVNNPMTISEGNRLVSNLIDDCFECNNHFRFYKTKK